MRNDSTKRTNSETTKTPTADAIEERVIALAEQLGRVVGTVQPKAEGWMDREALTKQIETVRDGATDLLKQLAARATGSNEPAASGGPAGARTQGRSGGVVDAPGKKHRKPMPKDPRMSFASGQSANMRATKTAVKTQRRRGRG